jgi:hypothetical protein
MNCARELGKMADSLFPQRFTPFEFYYLLEDCADYPSAFPIRLECRGSLDRAAFRRAFEVAHTRHPLLSARIKSDDKQWPIWVPGMPAPIRWVDVPILPGTEFVGPSSSAGLQVQVSQDGDKTVISFVFPHVAADGMGAFQFITDLLVAYEHEHTGDAGPPPFRPLETELLRDRDGHTLFHRRIKAIDLIRLAQVNLPLLFRRAAVVSNHDNRPAAGSHEDSAHGFLLHALTESETAKLSQIAQKLSVRLNDLLVRDYFLMLVDWNRETAESRRPIRIVVPTNLRRKKDYRMPAANVFSYAFLTRGARDCEHPARLLKSIHAEMAAIKREKRGVYYEAGLRLLCNWPGLLRRSLNRKRAFATAVFSNLGEGLNHLPLPLREGRRMAGDLVLETGYGAALIRPETRVSVAVHTYAGRMSIVVRCDGQFFGPLQQGAILRAYLNQLQTTLNGGA